MKSKTKLYLAPYLLIVPTLIVIAVFWFVPIVKAFLLTLTNAQLLAIDRAKFVGLSNYVKFFTDGDVWTVTRATLEYVVFGVFGAYGIGLFTAIIVNRDFWGRGVARTILILPWMVPQVVLVVIWRWMLDPKYGVVDFVLRTIGLVPPNFSWLGNPSLAMLTVLTATIWKEYPLAMLILLAGLKSIPNELYDAASVDGATASQVLVRITLPMLRYVSRILILLLIVWHFGNFVIIWLMTQGGPANTTATLTVFTYLSAFRFGDLGYGATIGMIIMVVTFLISVSYYRIFISTTESD